jgi:DNA-binding NarL/FixJ family response regulator
MTDVQVAVLASDPITESGAVAALQGRHRIRLVGGDEAPDRADVLIVLTNDVDGALMTSIEEFTRRARHPRLPVVLIANRLPEHYLLRAVECGLTNVVLREDASYETIALAAIDANQSRSHMPEPLLYELLDRVRKTQAQMYTMHGLTPAGLQDREVEVVRLLSEGHDTGQIANQLNYSERTIKNVIHSMMTRLELKTRSHAVAYAIRSGVV